MEFVPSNDLDHALIAAHASAAAAPDFYRQLVEGELFLLIPYHPEFENGKFKLENGMPCPFIMQRDADGEIVLLFTSEERAQEGMRNGKVPPNTYLIVSMEAQQALDVIGKMGVRALLNKNCSTPQFVLPPSLMADIASGEIFRTGPPDDPIEKTLDILAPENYPTEIIVPVSEAMARHRHFRAAWIFKDPAGTAEAKSGRAFQLLVLMDPHDDVIFHDIDLVIGAAQSKGDLIGRGFVDEDDPVYISQLFGAAEPFYLAADFARVSAPKNP